MFKERWRTRRIRELEKQVADLQAEVEARDRRIEVLQAEIDAYAEFIAMYRELVQKETYVFAERQAKHEQ